MASINLNANQVISGTAINMIAGALMVFLARKITGSGNIDIGGMALMRADIPLLKDIPVLGKLAVHTNLRNDMDRAADIAAFLVSAVQDALWPEAPGMRRESAGS